MRSGFVGFHAVLALALAIAACGGGGKDEPAFAIAAVVPAVGTTLGGTPVVLSGRGFAAAATVTFGGAPASEVVVVSATELRCTSPAHASGFAPVVVANSAAESTQAPNHFRFDAPATAVALRDQVVTVGVTVGLDGTGSSDPDPFRPLLHYAWSLVPAAGSLATLAGADTATPSFVADVAGTYVATLAVDDGTSASAPSSVTVRTSATASRVPDTGLATCAGATGTVPCPGDGAAFFGQDASYTLLPPRFTVATDTVLDEVTGLTWERADEGRYNWFEAAGRFDATWNSTSTDVCGSIAVGGFADWRLPSAHELYSLLSFASDGGPLDRAAFPGLGGGPYWTSTERSTDPSSPPAFVAFPLSSYGYGHRPDPFWVVCVRGPAWGVNAFVDQGDGTVRDDGTGLVWEQSPPAVAYNWRNALARCEGLSLGGRDDWRLPSAKELQTLGFPMDLAPFPTTQPGDYWTSTSFGGYTLTLDFSVDRMDSAIPAASLFVRCVR